MFSHDYFNGTTSKRNSPASDSGQLSNPSPYTTQTQTPRSESGTSLAQQLLTLEDKLDQQTRELNASTSHGADHTDLRFSRSTPSMENSLIATRR